MSSRAVEPSLVGEPCGQHGNYTFYKAFKYQLKGDDQVKVLMLGEFFFLRISPHDDPCIGELQLLWDDRTSDQLLSSTRLYFLPEQTPDGRLSTHGEHEVLAASEKVILRLSDLVSWITDQVDWMTGLKTQTVVQTIQREPTSDRWPSPYRSHNHPLAISSGLDFNDVIREKQVNGDSSSGSSVVVLSYPRYCRYRALLRRVENREAEWMNNPAVQMVINSLGIPSTTNKISILFCRDTFEHEALLQNDLNCDHLAPKLKGRPRKKTNMRGNSAANNCHRSSSPESNTSDESKASQIRTTRRSALNKNNSTEKTVQRRNSVVKTKVNNSNAINNNDVNGAEDDTHDLTATNVTKLKEMCIASEQAFLKHLNKFMRDRKTPIQRVPHLGFKQIDLFFFFSHAQELGGYDKITSNKLWKKLYDAMGGDPGSTSAATCTRRHYERLLLSFERFLNGEQEKKKGRKAKDSQKKGKKMSQKNNSTGATNGIKCKKKVAKQVNGVKTKNKCNDGQYSDDTSAANEKSTENEPQEEVEPKQPKLIVKFNLLKVKNSSQDVDLECNDSDEKDQSCDKPDSALKSDIKEVLTVKKLEVQPVLDFNSDTEDTDSDKKQIFDVKREELTEEEDNGGVCSVKKSVVEPKVESKLVIETTCEKPTTNVNSDSVIHLSPVSDICEDEEPISDIKAESVSTPSAKVDSQNGMANTKHADKKPNKPVLIASPLSGLSAVTAPVGPTPSGAPLPFPVAASPLFSISTLVNSVPPLKAEPMTSPPPAPTSTSSTPTLPTQQHFVSAVPLRATAPKPLPVSSPQLVMTGPYESYARRPTVIKTTNPMASTQYQPKPQLNYKTKSSLSAPTVPMPAHLNPLFSMTESKAKAAEVICNDVLDLSVKKRCLEADSRTSPSQALIDGSNCLDLSVKKRKLESPSKIVQDVPKAKSDHRSTPSATPTSLHSVTAMAVPATPPHKLCPPQHLSVNSVTQSVPKPSAQQSVQYPNQSHNKSVSQIELQKYVNSKSQQKTQQLQSYHKSNHNQTPLSTLSALSSPQSTHHQSSHHQSSRHSPHQSPQRQSQQVSHQTKHSNQSQAYPQKEHQMDRHQSQPNTQLVKPQVRHSTVAAIAGHHSSAHSAKEIYNQRDNQKQQSAHQSPPKSSHHSVSRESRQQQSPNYRNERSEDRMSSKMVSSAMVSLASMPSLYTTASSHRTSAPTISDYNPSLPTFNPGLYSSPNLWWPNGVGLPNVSTASSLYSAASGASMGPISPHMLASHPLLAGAYPPTTAEHLLAQLDSSNKAANYLAYKQLLDQHNQQTHPYQLFQHFYATK